MIALFFGLAASVLPEKLSSSKCQTCVALTQAVLDFVASNKTEKQIEHKLEKYCERTKMFKDMCDRYVEKYLPLVFKYIDEKAPTKICTLIKVCKKVSIPRAQNRVRANSAVQFDTESTPKWSKAWIENI